MPAKQMARTKKGALTLEEQRVRRRIAAKAEAAQSKDSPEFRRLRNKQVYEQYFDKKLRTELGHKRSLDKRKVQKIEVVSRVFPCKAEDDDNTAANVKSLLANHSQEKLAEMAELRSQLIPDQKR